MSYFAGLDVSMEETHICVLDGDGSLAYEATVASSPTAIAGALKKAPRCSVYIAVVDFPVMVRAERDDVGRRE